MTMEPLATEEQVSIFAGGDGSSTTTSFAPGDDEHELRLIRQIERLQIGSDEWVEMGAEPPSIEVILSTLELLARVMIDHPNWPIPARVVPSPSGSVLIEWHVRGLYMEAEVLQPGYAEWMCEVSPGIYEHAQERWQSGAAVAKGQGESVTDLEIIGTVGSGAVDSASSELLAA